MNPLVSIVCLSYNFEAYLDQCISGFLKQVTKFNFEIIICDDFSNDNSDIIIKKYLENNYKNISFKYHRHATNIGMQKNGLFCLKKCSGKYIALCDGDDFWTDPYKLQKQIDFLEGNHDFNLCYHEVSILHIDGTLKKNFIKKTEKHISSKFDLAVWGNYIHTCSVVIRNNYFFNNFTHNINLCDYILYINFVNDGKIMKLDENMAVYRYGEGTWSSSSNKRKQKFIIDNIYSILKTTDDDTIKEILKLRLNTYKLYSLPKYLSEIENLEDQSVYFELNEKTPFSILIKIIKKKFIYKFNFFFKEYKWFQL